MTESKEIRKCIKRIIKENNVTELDIKNSLLSTRQTNLRKIVIDCFKANKISKNEITEYLGSKTIKEANTFEISGEGLSVPSTSRLSSEEIEFITKECVARIKLLDFVHDTSEYPFQTWVVAATSNVLLDYDYEIFYRTCEYIMKKIKDRRNKKNQLDLFVFSTNERGNKITDDWKKGVNRFKNIIYLTMLTKYRLLSDPDNDTEDATFKEVVSDIGNLKKLKMKHILKNCKKIKDSDGNKFRECSEDVWSEAYSILTDSEIIKAIERIIEIKI